MIVHVTEILASWANFYVMIGGAAAALTGLMFVVITLVSGSERTTSTHDGIGTFSTPTVLYFCAALVTAATLCAPWHELLGPAIAIGLTGFAGIIYVLRLMYRAIHLETYKPDLEDWTWFWCLPFIAFSALLAASIALTHRPHFALFVIASAAVLLIFIGIRNAWDVVTYLAITYAEEEKEKSETS